ncbi:GPI inositol-deacylase PGAP1-like protein [Dioscorea alata]|uniref:GPI inositol-deacylase PGAP1-like protein n=1 Tax=Dioscorea alata TaxID=55571 RepID=A0ACB7W9W0_DIOAL|nr:GPI inositol-deacylase PGAP1-like protein [Dioscorea alata]
MDGFGAKFRVGALAAGFLWLMTAALFKLLKPVPNGCVMTYMYPTYIPITTPANVSSDKYGLFLYHEGWKKIDFAEHLKKLNGVPVLFIPGNGGSYKQVRSLAAESARAYQGGPFEPSFYQEATLLPVDAGKEFMEESDDFAFPSQYVRMLDWFAVDLEGEHSAMDGRILEEHTEYVVYAIHRILDQYRESRDSRSKDGAEGSENLPTSVILVGHSMGGFVARAALVHPHLRNSAVETIVTLSSPHQSPPIALQPSLGQFFSQVNEGWRKGYEATTTHSGRLVSAPSFSRVVVVSISGGIHDYQVRSKLASLDGIVPSSHGFMVGSSGMKNVWLSMEHQTILWCNQLVVQLSHTLLNLVNPETGQPFPSVKKRLLVFVRMLQSGLPQNFKLLEHMRSSPVKDFPTKNEKDDTGEGSQLRHLYSCSPSLHWTDDGLEKDIYVQSSSVTILAMDGKRRWLDIRKLGLDGKGHFIFVTNLIPCSGVRIHLWPERSKTLSEAEVSSHKKILEVTTQMIQIPAGPAPRQIEPGSQTEQAPPSAVLQLSPEEMHGFRFLTISVAPSPTISGRPPPAASMAVGQFFNPKDGQRKFSPGFSVRTIYAEEEMFLKEDHPLALNLSFSLSLGLFPINFSLRTVGCGIKTSGDQAGVDQSSLCKLRCFPPVALAWDAVSGLHIIPNLYSEAIVVDSSPAMWVSNPVSERTTILLLVDPHCSYKLNFAVSLTAAASRFLLLYSSQICGFMVAVILFALMRQADAWELDLSMPSLITAVELNLRLPLPLLLLSVLPISVSLLLSLLRSQPITPVASFVGVSTVCYLVANGSVILVILISYFVLYAAATVQVFIKKRWQAWEENPRLTYLRRLLGFSSVFFQLRLVRIIRNSPNLVVAIVTIPVICFIHPALGLMFLILSHALHCHAALCSNSQRKEFYDSRTNGISSLPAKASGVFGPLLPLDENSSSSPNSARSYGDSQLEIFNYQHGVLILHVLATLMFIPSLVAWLQRIGLGQRFPWFADSALCVGVLFHGLCGTSPDISSLSSPLPRLFGREIGLSLVYLLAGYYSFLSALALAPYRVFYAMASIGILSFAATLISSRNRHKGDAACRTRRRHSHKH